MLLEMAITQLLIGLSNAFTYMTPRTSSVRKSYHFIPLKGPGLNGLMFANA